MSTNCVTKGRRRAGDSVSVEAGKAKRGRSQKDSAEKDALVDHGFQMISEQIEKMFNRITALEQERTNMSTASESTVSAPQATSPLISRNNDTIINSPNIENTISIPQTNDNLTPCVNNLIDNTSIASGSNSGNIFIVRPAIDKPVFSGRGDTNPMKFLKRFKRYVDSVNGHSRITEIATSCLTGTALKLLEIFSDNWDTLADFERDFQKTFWGQRQQERAKYKFTNSFWNPSSGTTMSEHFAEQIDSVRFLTIPLSECEMVNGVMRHFPTDIQRLWFTKKDIVTIARGVEFLSDMEQNVIYSNEEQWTLDKTNRSSGNRGRGSFKRGINYINVAPAHRGRSSHRGRGQYRGRNNYGGNRGRSLPAIKFERASTVSSSVTDRVGSEVGSSDRPLSSQTESSNPGNE